MTKLVRSVLLSDAVTIYCQRYALRSEPKLRHHVNRWLRHVPQDRVRDFPAGVDSFRRQAARAGLSATTIETTITDLIPVVREFGTVCDPGRRLKRPQPRPSPPTVQELGRLYLQAAVPLWPAVPPSRRTAWWRLLLVLGSWSGLRLSDLLALRWDEINGQWISRQASKTGTLHRIPLTAVVARHLAELGPAGTGPILGHQTSRHQLYREFSRLCTAAGIRQIRPKQLRQYAVTAWSEASAEAGRIVHGCGLGVMRHYLDQSRVLAAAAANVELPEQFYSVAERKDRQSGESRLLDRFKRARSADRRLLLEMADRLAR